MLGKLEDQQIYNCNYRFILNTMNYVNPLTTKYWKMLCTSLNIYLSSIIVSIFSQVISVSSSVKEPLYIKSPTNKHLVLKN